MSGQGTQSVKQWQREVFSLVGDYTEDELFGRCEHVEREGYFVLVALALQPADEGGDVEHPECVGAVIERIGKLSLGSCLELGSKYSARPCGSK